MRRIVQFVDNLIERDLPRIRRRSWIAYPIAGLIFCAAALGRDFLSNWLPPSLPFLTFYMAVLLATLISGIGPGIAVIAASSAYAWKFYFSAAQHYTPYTAGIAISAFAFLCVLIVAVVQLLNRKVETLIDERARTEGLLQDSALGEIQLEQLNVELRHRLKNTFAVMSGLVSQSARYSLDTASFANALSGRLAAMGTAMDLVATRNFLGASLLELVTDTLKPLVPPGTERIRINGPGGIVPGDVASALALTLHELGTNAIKYGAWSNDKGRVSVTWTFDNVDEDEAKFALKWVESGGPRVTEPERKGLGTILIDSGFPMAQVKRTFSPGGVQCTISAVINLSTTRRTRGRASIPVS